MSIQKVPSDDILESLCKMHTWVSSTQNLQEIKDHEEEMCDSEDESP